MAKQKYWNGTSWEVIGTDADKVELKDSSNLFSTATNVEDALKELFTNVSNGKSLVGGAITDVDPNVVIPTDPTFQQLADAIGQISTGKKWATGSGVASTSSTISGLSFQPSVIVVKVDYGNDRFYITGFYYEQYETDTMGNTSNDYWIRIDTGGDSGSNAPFASLSNKWTILSDGFTFETEYSFVVGHSFSWLAVE